MKDILLELNYSLSLYQVVGNSISPLAALISSGSISSGAFTQYLVPWNGSR